MTFQMTNYQYVQLKEDAAASLGTNHAMFKAAACYIEALDRQMATSLGVPYSVLRKEEAKGMRKGKHESREREYLKWAHIDLNAKTI